MTAAFLDFVERFKALRVQQNNEDKLIEVSVLKRFRVLDPG